MIVYKKNFFVRKPLVIGVKYPPPPILVLMNASMGLAVIVCSNNIGKHSSQPGWKVQQNWELTFQAKTLVSLINTA
jgi:hypothetical protein